MFSKFLDFHEEACIDKGSFPLLSADDLTLEVKIFQTNFHYPLLRQERIMNKAGRTIHTRVMVADHLSFYLPTEETVETLREKLDLSEGEIVHHGLFHRLTFSLGESPIHALPLMINKLSILFPESLPEPDYLVSAAAETWKRQKMDRKEISEDTNQDTQWGLKNILNPSDLSWWKEIDCSSVVVAVVDSGVSLNHPDLRIWEGGGINGIPDKRYWRFHEKDWMSNEQDLYDEDGHGTHISGIIGGQGNRMTGVAPGASIMVCKFLEPVNDSDYMGTVEDAMFCIDWALKKGVQIFNCSCGFSEFHQKFSELLKDAMVKGAVFIAASGFFEEHSTNHELLPLVYPALYAFGHRAQLYEYLVENNRHERTKPGTLTYTSVQNVISVAALNQDNTLYKRSAYGHVAAPGVSIYSCGVDSLGPLCCLTGSSMATAFVTGAITKIKQRYPYLYSPLIFDIIRYNGDSQNNPQLLQKTSYGGRLNLSSMLHTYEKYLENLRINVNVCDGYQLRQTRIAAILPENLYGFSLCFPEYSSNEIYTRALMRIHHCRISLCTLEEKTLQVLEAKYQQLFDNYYEAIEYFLTYAVELINLEKSLERWNRVMNSCDGNYLFFAEIFTSAKSFRDYLLTLIK